MRNYCAPWDLPRLPRRDAASRARPNGLPLGIQIVGRYREDLRVLRIAKWMEAALGFDPVFRRSCRSRSAE